MGRATAAADAAQVGLADGLARAGRAGPLPGESRPGPAPCWGGLADLWAAAAVGTGARAGDERRFAGGRSARGARARPANRAEPPRHPACVRTAAVMSLE